MKIPLLAVTAATVLSAGFFSAPVAASAAATCVLSSASMANKQLIIGTGNDGDTTRIAATVTNCSPTAFRRASVKVRFYSPEENTWANTYLTPKYLGGNTYQFTGSETLYANDMVNDLGSMIAEKDYVYLVSNGKQMSRRYVGERDFQRKSQMGKAEVYKFPGWFDAKTVKKGQSLEVFPALKRADWDNNKYRQYNTTVTLQFRTKSGSYKNVRTGKLDNSGHGFSATATVDGFFRFVFKGNGTTSGAVSEGTFLNVK